MTLLEKAKPSIMDLLPHDILKQAPPFLFIDKIFRFDGVELECVKHLAYNEPYFAGHFPGDAIVPGVLMIEMAAQASMILSIALEDSTINKPRIGYLVRTQDFRFYTPGRPGDSLHIIVKMKERVGNYHTTKIQIVNGQTRTKIAKGELIFFLPEEA
ncbi:3-hydroxyacyl-ACP dehydratase FabZ family protein [Paenibacillus sp. An7]|uniref:3-hydroxyacyl-ACP dehydratase FabZ family protein n=1 Tax=Paenibacillus sp. An7 TaxID=2689577 RepID=UPI00135A4746|nr:3-hydroxyacyl-ACP dehydratase FabZ family protein [Paenibacillus sp. An7]